MTFVEAARLESQVLNAHRVFMAWVESLLATQAPKIRKAPVFIGINGPQGSGKTTLTRAAVGELRRRGLRAVAISVDDFYLTREEQIALAREHSDNPYFQQRGYPGTHDITLGTEILERLKRLSAGERLRLPLYDKSAHGGLGDRADSESWPEIEGPLDCVFLEGWMLGFRAEDPAKITDPSLREINHLLARYQAWTSRLDSLVHLSPPELETIVRWRIEAEERMKASGKAGMTSEQVEVYVRLFLPAYALFLPAMKGGSLPPHAKYLVIPIGADRMPAR